MTVQPSLHKISPQVWQRQLVYEVQRCSSLFIDVLDHGIDTLLIMTLFCILTVFTASVRVIPAYQSLDRLTQLVRLLERGYQLTLLSSLVVKHGRLAGSASPRSPSLSSVAITEYHQNLVNNCMT